MRKVAIWDTTLRDGAQANGITFSVKDKVNIAKALDDFGVSFIEGGNPFSNPKDAEFFERMKSIPLKSARLVAFGSTRRKDLSAISDPAVKALIDSNCDTVVIFGKAWDFHVSEILEISLEEHLEMIKDTVEYLCKMGKQVYFDAEHFFDGFKSNSEYAISTLIAAQNSGASGVCLCDTNGGSFPDEVQSITKEVKDRISISFGIHTHNDTGMAVANSVVSVMAGADVVQGTINGFGERSGNANLSTVICNLQLKRNIQCVPEENIKNIYSLCRFVAETANMSVSDRTPYVGRNAFAHKGGMHIDGVCKNSRTYEHIDPTTIGNLRRLLMSEMAGRSSITHKLQALSYDVSKDTTEVQQMVETVKNMENEGYQFEAADGTFRIVAIRQLTDYKKPFSIDDIKVIEETKGDGFNASAVIRVSVGDKCEYAAAEGDGPVNALDKALRKALEIFYPSIAEVSLTDYKVRVIDSNTSTAAKVRVLIESTDGNETWSTMGVSTDIVEASCIALVDSMEYKLITDNN
ncbi:MAG: citramalate synthase [Eubacteriales bacterium]|nr:citramalate synthase [Eubacteriales bacterium]